jgi:DNA helicase-2/ATP-dependent DNA helicase PcrA
VTSVGETVASGRDWLTREQRAAVEWGDGPLMVLAGAGTGKTTVVVERVRHLLQRDPNLLPENILVLTYNVRAAAELNQRLERALGLERASRLWVHNFHSFGSRLLSAHGAEVGLGDGSRVLDQVGQQLLLLELRPAMSHFLYHDLSLNPSPILSRFAEMISRAKDELVTPAEFAAFVERKRRSYEAEFGDWQQAVAAIEARRRDNSLGPISEVRSELRRSREAGEARADRVARRDASGINYAVGWNRLSADCRDLAEGLKETYLRDAAAFDVLRLIEQAEVYELYQRTLHERGLLDFGEQQLRAIELLRDRPNVLLRYQRQFRHVLVDEFQDANMAQILLLELIGRGPDKSDNVVVVGDDDQSIYRFRGASYAAFRQFEERFGRPPEWASDRPAQPVTSLPLLENRRSSANILGAAERLIVHNPARLKTGQPLRPIRSPGAAVEIVYARDEADEADTAVERIRTAFESLPDRLPNHLGGDRPKRWSDVAVLYRRHRHRQAIVERLRAEDIPYALVGGTGIFAEPEVRDVEAALRVIADPDDSVSFTRLLTAGPWRFDAVEIARLSRSARWDNSSIFRAASAIYREGRLAAELDREPGGREAHRADAEEEPDGEAGRALRTKLDRLFACLDGLIPRGPRDGPSTILTEYLTRTGVLHDLIAAETSEAQRNLIAIATVMRFVSRWQQDNPRGSLTDFVSYLDVFQQAGGDVEADVGRGLDVEGVQLMTVYQAKGLEYEVVVVPRLVEGQFPDTREEDLVIPLELLKQKPPDEFATSEERRLCFVAMTRARRQLVLTTIDNPTVRATPSRFVAEVAGTEAETRGAAERGERGVPGPEAEPAAGVVVVRRELSLEPEPGAGAAQSATEAAASATPSLERLMPVPAAYERRYLLRRRAVELIGALELAGETDPATVEMLIDDLLKVAREAAGEAEEDRRRGIDPLTLRVLSRHSPAGQALLSVAPLPGAFSHSQFRLYQECPLAYSLTNVFRIPSEERKGYFEFGSAIHGAFETFTLARREARAASLPDPGFETLQAGLERLWEPAAFADSQAAAHYQARSQPVLRRFFDRELRSPAEALLFEQPFLIELDPGNGGVPIHFKGFIDRIDRHPDGSIEVIDYKTGRSKSQHDVDADEQLSAYALALRSGAIPDPATGEPLPAPSRLTLYFAESDLALSTTRTDEQLDAFRDHLIAVALRIRSGDFAANPEYRRCGQCDYRGICPSRWGDSPGA